MNAPSENIIVNSCEYTPIYLIPSTSVTQAGSYIITQSDQDVRKPIADNLKSYYENSGNIENGLISSPKPRILKKLNASKVGNNLKLASFLLPKTDNINLTSLANLAKVSHFQTVVSSVQSKQPIPPVNTVTVKPPVTTKPTAPKNVDNNLPRVEVDRKIVRVGTIPYTKRTYFPRVIQKNKRLVAVQKGLKEKTKEKDKETEISKHTSVQLIKLGETYHSLNQLSDDQIKIVDKALKIFGDPEKELQEPAYDPATNTTFFYKVVSPRDLTVVGGRNKNVIIKKKKRSEEDDQKKSEVNKQKIVKEDEEPVVETPVQKKKRSEEDDQKKSEVKKQKIVKEDEQPVVETPVQKKKRNEEDDQKKSEVKKQKIVKEDEKPVVKTPVQTAPKVTRSGRTVRLPKQMRTSDAPHKPKKKVGSVVNCFQCSAEFCSLYRLQRHYEHYPTHIPARIHSSLFHCLLAVIKGTSHRDQANIFIQQLEHLIDKIRTLLPCIMKEGNDGKLCTINEDIGRLFGITPGKYNINVDALNCIKDKEGHCIHNPAPKPIQVASDIKPSQVWVLKPKEEILNNEAETEDCARINSVDKWPNVTKRIWKLKQQKEHNVNAKKIRLASENEQPIELGTEDVVAFICNENSIITVANSDGSQEILPEPLTSTFQAEIDEEPVAIATMASGQSEKPKPYGQFHSAHFDIRSSPIKLPSSLVRKFQFHPDKMSNFEVQILRPLADNKEISDQTQSNSDLQSELQELLTDNIELPKEPDMNNEVNSINYKKITNPTESEVDFMKSNILFETGLTPKKDTTLGSSLLNLDNDTPSKANDLIESNLLEIGEKSNLLIGPSYMQVNDKSNGLFSGNTNLHAKEDQNDFYDPSYRHVKPKCNSLIGSSVIQIKSKTFESALSHVKQRSNYLFDEPMLNTENKCNSLVESLINVKHESLFDLDLPHEKERSGSLFHSSLLDIKDKDSLLDTSLLQDDNSNLFNSSLAHSKDDGMMQQSLNSESLLHKEKDNIRNSINIDIHDEISLGTSDSRLLNASQSVLNFLDSLGNESLGLSYPETEIRNNSVDFQLDLFSFSNS